MAQSRHTGGRSRVTLGLLILTSITVLTLDFRDSDIVRSAREAAATVLGPVRDVVERGTEPVTDAWHGATGYGDLEKENERLKDRLAELEGDSALDDSSAEELAELLEQVDIEFIDDIQTVHARVVSGPVSNFTNTIEISKGTNAGLKQGMPVVTGAGLVGRVVQTSANRSTILLLTDEDFRVGVKIEKRPELGTAIGSGRGEPLIVDSSAEPDVKISKGRLRTTTGGDSVFPASIPVARVTSTREATSGLSLELIAEPMVDTEALGFVTVLLWEPTE